MTHQWTTMVIQLRPRRVVLLWSVFGVLFAAESGCSRAFGGGLAYGTSGDVKAILAANGVHSTFLTCKNVRLSGSVVRAVSCTLSLSKADVGRLTAALPLAVGKPLHGDIGYSEACEHTAGFASQVAGVEVLAGENTKVKNGIGPVRLHVVSATGAACIEVVYPWSG